MAWVWHVVVLVNVERGKTQEGRLLYRFISVLILNLIGPSGNVMERCEKVDVVLKGCRNRLSIRNLNKEEEVFILVSNKVAFFN